jgi:peptide/nickel transport system ATP-binding protein
MSQDLSLDFRLRTEVLHAARNVSFELKRGKTLCLVGESGSGKSVTARALLRIIDGNGSIASGRILLMTARGEIDIATLNERSTGPAGDPRRAHRPRFFRSR